MIDSQQGVSSAELAIIMKVQNTINAVRLKLLKTLVLISFNFKKS